MRFFKKFSRWVGAGGTALGSDSVPTDPPNVGAMDNLMVSQVTSTNAGWPCHRVAVVYHGPGGSPADVSAKLYFWEDLTERWYQIGDAVTLKSGHVSFFDTVGLLDRAPVGADLLEAKSGGLEVVLVPALPDGGPASGEYIFALGSDLTTAP